MKAAEIAVPHARAEIKLTEAQLRNFHSKINKDGPLPDQTNPQYAGLDQCWMWTASTRSDGYGAVRIEPSTLGAHRIAWVLANGQIPNDGSYHGICVCHKCDVRRCVNPSHLFLGTHKANTGDREAKGRGNQLRGDAHALSKLTAAQVIEIRASYAAGLASQTQLAVRFGVHSVAICNAINRKTWKHI